MLEHSAAQENLQLTDEEQELVRAELVALLPALSGERRDSYLALADAVEQKLVPLDLLPLLEGLTKLSLETGRARRLYRAEGERILTDLFFKTPNGKEIRRSLHEVNKALSILEGKTLHGIRISMRTLGHIILTVETEKAVITIAIRPDAVTVDSISVGMDAGLG